MPEIRYAFKDHNALADWFEHSAMICRRNAEEVSASGNSYAIREQVAEYVGREKAFKVAADIARNILILPEDKT